MDFGFTTAAYTGNLGGFRGGAEKCQLEFPNSRMCTYGEVQLTTSLPETPNVLGWVNRLAANGELQRSETCRGGVSVETGDGVISFTREWSLGSSPSEGGQLVDRTGSRFPR